MNEQEVLVRYAKLHLTYMQVLEQLQSSQRECAKLQQRIEELTPKPPDAPQPTESQLVSEAT